MEVIIKPINKNLNKYIEIGINNFLLPLKDYSVSYTSYFNLEEIKSLKSKYPTSNIFISIDKNIMNFELDSLKEILLEINKLNIKGLFFYDFCILKFVKDLNLSFDLVWNGTHMTTNYRTCNYYNDLGVKYALLSKEITKDEIIEIINKSSITSIVELITYPTVAFSKRKLITNYYRDMNKDTKSELDIKERVSNDNYHLEEGKNGTIFLKDSIVNGSSILEELLNSSLKYILLKEDLFDSKVFFECVSNIIEFINNYKSMNDSDKQKWLNKQNKLLGEDTGFFFKKTIYKVK